MKKHILLTTLTISTILTSCSSMKKSISLGASSGMTAGLLLTNGDSSKTGQNMAAGLAIGGLASYFIHKSLEKRDAVTRRETLFNLDKFGTYAPKRRSSQANSSPFSLSPAQVEEELIETHIQDGKRLIESHRVWTISGDSQWIETPTKGGN